MEHIEDRHGHIQIDSSGQYLYYATSGGTIWKQQITIGISYPSADWTPLINVGSKVTSFHMTSDDKIITTSLGDGGRSGGLFCFIPPKSSIGYISELFSVSPRKTSVWTSSVAGDRIVFGADRMAIYIQGWRSERIQQVKLSTGSDVFSTAIDLPERHNLVYLGCRNGNVQAFDLNQPNLFYNTNSGHHSNNSNSSNRAASIFSGIGHKESSVQCMKRASENYLVTAATNGEILAWDTRFISTNTVNSKVGSFSKPIMDIRKPMDGYSTKVLFDINRDETLLAAESIGSKLSLWSLRTGDRIRDLETSGAINSLKFSNESPGIWVAVNDLVQYWGLE
ncbi:hypothetical protein BGZ76_008128 [Entomortierella beljakovae]|nr:hypothetical protein BGZ76_008128 [Entomortierella beljakovae]